MHRDTLKQVCRDHGRKTIPLPTPELLTIDGNYFVRELRGDDLVFVAKAETGLEDRVRWAIRSLSDKEGNRVLTDQDLEWIGGEGGLPTPILERAYWAAREVTGYTEENRKSFLKTSAAGNASGSASS